MIESWYRRNDHRTILGGGKHAAKVSCVQWCFPHDQNQTAAFFECDIGGSARQGVRRSVCDVGKVRIEHGMTIIPRVLNEPDEMAAPRSAF